MDSGVIVGGGAPPGLVAFEAELGGITGGATVTTSWPDYTGEGFIDFLQPSGATVTWTVAVEQTGRYALGFRYALAETARSLDGRPLTVSVNGIDTVVLPFLPTGDSFADWAVQWTELLLPAGTVTLSVATIDNSGANLDQVLIENTPVVVLNSAPDVSGALGPVTLRAGATATLSGAVLTDPDVADLPIGVLTLADGSALPDFFTFDGVALTLTATRDAVAGSYNLRLWANDGQAASSAGLAFAVQVQAAATIAADLDGDGLRNRRDTDDDNDGLRDVVDPFLADASNGRTVRIDPGSRFVLDFATVPTGAPAGWGYGMTGLAANGTATPETLGFDSESLSFADGALQIENAGTGTLANDSLMFGAQFGVDPNARFLTISVLLDNPYDTHVPVGGESFGLVIGTGDQENYVRLALVAARSNAVGLRLDTEAGGVDAPRVTYTIDRPAVAQGSAGDTMRLTFEIDTLTGTLVPHWIIETATRTLVGEGAAVTLVGDVLAAVRGDGATGLAIGVAASSGSGEALDLDVLEFTVEGSGGAPDIALTGQDAPFLTDRVVFNWIDDPSQNLIPDREYKDTGTVRITNSGDGILQISSLALDGPFKFLDASDLAVRELAAGATLDVEIGFDRSAFTPPSRGTGGQFEGALEVRSNDADEAVIAIDLGGWWQTVPEAGREPTLNDILEVFGFGNRVDPEKLRSGLYEKAAPEEVLAPYWKLAPGYTEAWLVQIASFEDAGKSTFVLHNIGDQGDARPLLQQDDLWNQSFFPILSDDSTQTKIIDDARVPDQWIGDDWFGFRASGTSSDPTLNRDPGREGEIRGHFGRFLQAIDADGVAMPDTYILAFDMNGVNLDYNDVVYVIRGITPEPELLLI